MAPAERHGRTNRGKRTRPNTANENTSRDRPVKISCSFATVARMRPLLSSILISSRGWPCPDHSVLSASRASRFQGKSLVIEKRPMASALVTRNFYHVIAFERSYCFESRFYKNSESHVWINIAIQISLEIEKDLSWRFIGETIFFEINWTLKLYWLYQSIIISFQEFVF